MPEAGASTIAIAAPDAAAAAPSGDQAARLDKLAGELSTSAATSALAHDAAAGHLRDLVVPVAQQGAEAVGALVRNKSMMDELSAAAARVSRAIATRPTIANAVNQAQQISRHAQDLLPSLQASEAVLARAVAVIDPLDFVSTEGKRALRSGLRAARAATSLARSSSIAASAIKDG